MRVVRLTSWGLSASLVAFTAFASDAAGFLDGGTAPWLLAAQFAVALAVGLVLARPEPRGRPRTRSGRPPFWHSSPASSGSATRAPARSSLWHLALTIAVAGTLVTAAARDLPGLMWIGALGGVIWIGAIAAVVGESAKLGPSRHAGRRGLVGLALLVARIRPIVGGTPARL